jgi:hypothetical protein
MAASWFCEKSGWIGKVEDVKPMLLKKTTDFNWQSFWGGGFLPGWIVKYADSIRFDSSRARYHLVLGFRLSICYRLVAIWWMANKGNFCFILAFHNFATLGNRLTYQCPNSWPVVITMKKKLAGTWKKHIGYWPVQINGNKFATGEFLKTPVEVVKGRISVGWVQKSPEPWFWLNEGEVFWVSQEKGYVKMNFIMYFFLRHLNFIEIGGSNITWTLHKQYKMSKAGHNSL